MGRLYPFKITNLTKGAQKARRRMQNHYGRAEGDRIWRQKAEELGEGNTLRERINNTYKTGARKEDGKFN
jgi:hypothetical protein